MDWKRLLHRQSGPQRLTPDLRDRIRRSFDEASQDEEHFPSTIDPRIYHVKLILDYFGDLAGKRVLDVGCGKGRFARILQERHPAAEIWGLDISEEMLKFVPAGIHTRAGSMTELPFDDALVRWRLRHRIAGARGGDRCGGAGDVPGPEAGRPPRDHRQERRAFRQAENAGMGEVVPPRELEKLLRRDCREVSSQFISYWEDVEPDGMFLAWLAEK